VMEPGRGRLRPTARRLTRASTPVDASSSHPGLDEAAGVRRRAQLTPAPPGEAEESAPAVAREHEQQPSAVVTATPAFVPTTAAHTSVRRTLFALHAEHAHRRPICRPAVLASGPVLAGATGSNKVRRKQQRPAPPSSLLLRNGTGRLAGADRATS